MEFYVLMDEIDRVETLNDILFSIGTHYTVKLQRCLS